MKSLILYNSHGLIKTELYDSKINHICFCIYMHTYTYTQILKIEIACSNTILSEMYINTEKCYHTTSEIVKTPQNCMIARSQRLSYIVDGNNKWNDDIGRDVSCFLKLNLTLSYDPSNIFLSIYTRVLKTYPHKALHINCHHSFVCKWQKLEQPQFSLLKMEKIIDIHLYNIR